MAASPCGEEELVRRQTVGTEIRRSAESAGHRSEVGPATESSIRSLSGGGQPLSHSERSFFEPRFGAVFSGVRLHTGDSAGNLAQSIQAQAFTVGGDIVFGRGQYAPGASEGKRLLAHELTHVVQQGQAGDIKHIQRTCNPGPIKAKVRNRGDCTDNFDNTFVAGSIFKFKQDCDEFKPGQRAALIAFVGGLPAGTTIEIHGSASVDGPLDFNQDLGCARALKAKSVLPGATITGIINHGPVPGPVPDRMSVVIKTTTPPPTMCGPEATDWFILQVKAAKRNPTILEIKANLEGAHKVAARYGFSAERVAEGGVAKKVLAQEIKAGSPARTAEATAQITASVPGQKEFGRALGAATAPIPFVGAPEQIVLLSIRRAAIAWQGLVGTGKPFDFKNDSTTMKGPTSAHCPNGCANTITLCPITGSECYRTDVPGNLFYAHVGRFVGWTELSLQLGSEFAQLESTKTWDPPEDTRMISFGFGLPDPLTRASVCAAINAARSSFLLQACRNCPEVTGAAIK